MSSDLQSIFDQFHRFIQLSQPLASTQQPESDFRRFIQESTRLIIGPDRTSLRVVDEKITTMCRWLVSHDLLRIARFSYVEDAYTELMAWALHPGTHPESGMRRQCAWLRSLPFGRELHFESPATPRTQFYTNDGIPDLILEYETFVVVVEAKTGAEEHAAPSGLLQTKAYPVSVKHALRLPDETSVYMVYITPDRRRASNPESISTSFVDFSLALASELDAISLPEDLRWAYAMLFTHFLTCAVPPGTDTPAIIHNANEWRDHLGDDAFLGRRLNRITEAIQLFVPGEMR